MVINGNPYKTFEKHLLKAVEGAQNILDVGTSQRFFKELKPYENILNQKNYIAAGYNPSKDHGAYNCDCHQDIEEMTFEDNKFDTVICLEVLEHVKNPFRAAQELKRVIKPGGRLFLTTPFLTQYHGKGSLDQSHESYPDFWRFTHEGLQNLFSDLDSLQVIPLDGPVEFRLKQLRLGNLIDNYSLIRKIVDFLDRPRLGKSTTRHLVCGIKK